MTTPFLSLDLRSAVPRPMQPPRRAVLCLGSFDGVHRAHVTLLEAGQTLVKTLHKQNDPSAPTPRAGSLPCGVFCFFRPAQDYLPHRAADAPAHLTPLRQKLALLRAAGMDFACLCDFPAVRDLPPAAFLDRLEAEIGCVGAVCGYNYRFGRNAAGTPVDLVTRFGTDRTVVLPEMTLDGGTVSASRIRSLLLGGDAARAARLLGRPYSLETTVTHGKQLGRTLGFPTANQYFLPEALVPATGVYAARCHTAAGVFPAVANIGTHPTVDTHARVNCETYLIGYEGDLYGTRMTVELLAYLRPEEHFSGINELIAAIRRDVARVQMMDI